MSRRTVLVRIAALAAIYFVTGRLGLLLPILQKNVTLLWAPSGVALAALLLFGPRLVPGVFLGAFLVNLSTGTPPGVALGIATGNTLEALTGLWLFREVAGFRTSLERVRDVLALVVLAAGIAPIAGATFGGASLVLGGLIPVERAPGVWGYWWLGDAMGILLVTPVLLTWSETRARRGWPLSQVLEALALPALMILVSLLTLGAWMEGSITNPPLSFTIFPFLVWAALRFGQRGAASVNLLAVSIAIWATLQGIAPFVRGTLEERLVYLHIYMTLAAVTSMLLAAIFAERFRAEGELRQAMAVAREASEAKDRFLATLSHELRTPLAPVLAIVSRLEEDERARGFRDDLVRIRRNVELEARLIDDLLDLTRIARGKLELHPEVTDARKIVEHTLQICCEAATASGRLRVVTELDAGDHRIWADPSRVTQILWNLLNNAAKFTPAGGTITVRSWREEGPPTLVLEVEDTGAGIEPERLPEIFGAFEQAHARSRRIGGLGLGLAISRAIAGMHGGSLTARSEGTGRGAAFTLRLPVGVLPALEERPEPAEAQRPEAAEARSLAILLVEDHADTAQAMAELLGLLGHRVTTAGSVTEGLAAAERIWGNGGLDLVVSDLGLPDGSGVDLMRELSARYRVPGIALSGYGMEEDVRQSLEAGFSRHLTKPVNPQSLKAALHEVAGPGGR